MLFIVPVFSELAKFKSVAVLDPFLSVTKLLPSGALRDDVTNAGAF